MIWYKLKDFVSSYNIVLFMIFVTLGWVILYTFFILLAIVSFALQ